MLSHALRLIAVVAAILLCTLLPFLPGRYDSLAAPLSTLSRIFGIVSLLLTPFGTLLSASAHSSWLAGKRRVISIAAATGSSLVLVILSLAAWALSSTSLAVAIFALGAYALSKALPRLTLPVAGFYLLVIPIAVLSIQRAFLHRAVDFARSRAIRNSAQLIADIERYRANNGRYPLSIFGPWKDYSPGVIGVEKFHYEPAGEAYNLLFELPARELSTREIVAYNPLDEQNVTSHTADRLNWTHEQLTTRRTYYAVHDAPQPHWKYFWFD